MDGIDGRTLEIKGSDQGVRSRLSRRPNEKYSIRSPFDPSYSQANIIKLR